MLKPLDMLREIRDDNQLSSTEKLVLVCCVLRTDNGTRRVRVSQQNLATDTGLTRRTVSKVLNSAAAKRYLESIRNGRQLDLSWRDMRTTFPSHENEVPTICYVSAHRSTSPIAIEPVTSESVATEPVSVPMLPVRQDFPDGGSYLEAEEHYFEQMRELTMARIQSSSG